MLAYNKARYLAVTNRSLFRYHMPSDFYTTLETQIEPRHGSDCCGILDSIVLTQYLNKLDFDCDKGIMQGLNQRGAEPQFMVTMAFYFVLAVNLAIIYLKKGSGDYNIHKNS